MRSSCTGMNHVPDRRLYSLFFFFDLIRANLICFHCCLFLQTSFQHETSLQIISAVWDIILCWWLWEAAMQKKSKKRAWKNKKDSRAITNEGVPTADDPKTQADESSQVSSWQIFDALVEKREAHVSSRLFLWFFLFLLFFFLLFALCWRCATCRRRRRAARRCGWQNWNSFRAFSN